MLRNIYSVPHDYFRKTTSATRVTSSYSDNYSVKYFGPEQRYRLLRIDRERRVFTTTHSSLMEKAKKKIVIYNATRSTDVVQSEIMPARYISMYNFKPSV